MRLLDHAYSARVFGLRSVGANTDVIVTVYAAPLGQPQNAAQGSASTSREGSASTSRDERAAQEKGNASAPVPFQFTYSVEGVDRISLTLGTAVALHRGGATNEAHPRGIVSPPPAPLLFFNWRFWESSQWIVERFGLQLGASLKDARDIIAAKDPGSVNVYFGAAVWPLKTVVVSAGLVDAVATSSPSHVQLGFYVGASADVLVLYDIWTGPKRVLAQ